MRTRREIFGNRRASAAVIVFAMLLTYGGVLSIAATVAADHQNNDPACSNGDHLHVTAWNEDSSDLGVGGSYECGKESGSAGTMAKASCSSSSKSKCDAETFSTTEGSSSSVCSNSHAGQTAEHARCSTVSSGGGGGGGGDGGDDDSPGSSGYFQSEPMSGPSHETLTETAEHLLQSSPVTSLIQIDATEQTALVCLGTSCWTEEPDCQQWSPVETPRCVVEI